jgi:hypothetical protein
MLHNSVHVSEHVLNLGTPENLLSRELMPAETAGQICFELQLSQADLEQPPALRTG